MRRIIPFMIIVTMLLSMGLSATATQQKEFSNDVYGKYEAGETPEQVITVDIDWVGMNFTYNGATKIWDSEEHRYKEHIPGGWSQSNASIAFTNHTNLILQAEISYEQHDNYKEMGLAFAQNQPVIGSAANHEGTQAGVPYTVVIPAVPTGKLPEGTKDNTKVGTIKVTVTPVESHLIALGNLESIYNDFPLKASNPGPGVAYYDTAQDISILTELFDAAYAEAETSDDEVVKNVTLNAFLTEFYGRLRLMPDQTVE